MRRKDREMSREFALSVVDKCEYAVMAMTDTDNMPYCLPVTIVREGDSIYFHSAMEGRKIDILRDNPSICMTCVGDTNIPPGKFTTEFESAVIYGAAHEVTCDSEKIHALELLCRRHTPANMHQFDASIERSLSRTGIWKITIRDITGKRKKYEKDGVEMKYGRME